MGVLVSNSDPDGVFLLLRSCLGPGEGGGSRGSLGHLSIQTQTHLLWRVHLARRFHHLPALFWATGGWGIDP